MKCLAIFACLLCCSLAQTDNTCPLKDDPNCKCDISLTLILCDATASDSPSTLPQFLKANSNFSVLRMEGYQRNNTIPDNFFDFGFGVKRLEIVNCSFTKFEPLAFAGAFEESVSEFLLSSETIEDFPDLSMMRNLTSVFLQFNSVQKLTNLSSLPVNLKVLSISGPNLIELDTDSFDKIWSLQQLSISAPKMEFLNFTSVKSLVNLDTVRLATNITSFFGLERIRKLIINSNICNLSLPDFDHLELLEITGDLCLDELTKNVRGVFLLKFILEVSNDNVTALDLINFTIPKFELITYQTVDNSAVKIAGNSEITSLSLDRIPVCSNSFMSFVHLNTLRLGYVNWPFIPEEIGQLKSLKAVSSAPVICNCSNFWVYQKRHIGLFQDPSLPETYCLNSDMTFVRYLRRTALDKSCANFVGGVPVFQEEKCVGIIPTTTMITTTSPTTISTVDFTSTTHEGDTSSVFETTSYQSPNASTLPTMVSSTTTEMMTTSSFKTTTSQSPSASTLPTILSSTTAEMMTTSPFKTTTSQSPSASTLPTILSSTTAEMKTTSSFKTTTSQAPSASTLTLSSTNTAMVTTSPSEMSTTRTSAMDTTTITEIKTTDKHSTLTATSLSSTAQQDSTTKSNKSSRSQVSTGFFANVFIFIIILKF